MRMLDTLLWFFLQLEYSENNSVWLGLILTTGVNMCLLLGPAYLWLYEVMMKFCSSPLRTVGTMEKIESRMLAICCIGCHTITVTFGTSHDTSADPLQMSINNSSICKFQERNVNYQYTTICCHCIIAAASPHQEAQHKFMYMTSSQSDTGLSIYLTTIPQCQSASHCSQYKKGCTAASNDLFELYHLVNHACT